MQNVLVCPACKKASLKESAAGMECVACIRRYPYEDGVLNLLIDPTMDTMLDVDEYEEWRPSDPVNSEQVYSYYRGVVERYGLSGGECVELGAGLGNLSYGLIKCSTFSRIYCSDVSARFLGKLKQWMPADGVPFHLYTFDAASLPFADGVISAVFAHSVLHHLLHYENTLRESHRVLRPGGVAVFAEPMMDFYAIHSFLAVVILMLDSRNPSPVFNDHERCLLSGIAAHAPSTAQSMRYDREKLARQEDKHVFLLEDVRALSRDLGFRDFAFTPAYIPHRLGDAFQKEMGDVLGRHQGDARKLEAYQCIFDAVTDRLGVSYGDRWPASFGYLTFVK